MSGNKVREVFIGALAVLSVFVAQAARACEMPEGFHEYGTFGKKTVYLYHFPMFGSIHAYQVLIEADLSVAGKNVNDVFFSTKAANPNTLFVTSPAKVSDGSPDYWVLPDYTKKGAVFNARLHYRVAGVAGKDEILFDSVQVTVKKVLLNRLLKSETIKTPDLKYFAFGNSNESYLLHLASWDPDFDQVLETAPLGLSGPEGLDHFVLDIDRHANSETDRLKVGVQATGLSDENKSFVIQVLKELFEFKIDIQH